MTAHEDDLLLFSVATVWREERVSCPHPDILQAFESGALARGAADFIRFHLAESQCPFCNAVLEELRCQQEEAQRAGLEGLKDRLMRSTVAELRRASGA